MGSVQLGGVADEARDADAHLHPTAEQARMTRAIVDSARGLNFKYLAEAKGATATARFGMELRREPRGRKRARGVASEL